VTTAGDVLSVIVPTYNRRASALRTVRALASQRDLGGDIEVIAVVDGSTDGTAAALREATWPFPLAVIEQPQRGQAAARNRGAATACGGVLVFLDDDVVPRPDFLKEVRASLDRGADYVLTTLRMGDWVPDTLLSREFKRWTSAPCPAPDTPIRYDELLFSANGVRRQCFEIAGRFDETFTGDDGYGDEDIDLGLRLARAGAVIRRCPNAVAETEPLLDAAGVLARERSVGRNDVRLVRRYPELAADVFASKITTSRAHRLFGGLLLTAYWIAPATALLRAAVVAAIATGAVSKPLTTAWSCCRAIQYWRGVIDAGGRAVVESVWPRGA
jgi:glycosyltransferase involved in cell wall biosynthesis